MMTTKRGLRLGVHSLIVGIVYLSLSTSAMAWNEPLWIRQFGTNEVDFLVGRGIATDGRSVYLTGWGDGPSWIVKYNDAGRLLWKQQTERGLVISGVATDTASNVYVAGQNLATFLWFKAWFAKYGSGGVLLWEQHLPLEISYIGGIATDIGNNIYIIEITTDSIVWLAKYDADGVLLWKQLLGSNASINVISMTTDIKGGVFLAGSTEEAFGGANPGSTDAWVAKYDSGGHPLWKRQFGTGEEDEALFVAAGAVGCVYVYGVSTSVDDEVPTDIYWLAKYDRVGHMYWKRKINISDQPIGVDIDAIGNVYLAGGNIGQDAWLAKYNVAGRKQWKRQLGTSADDYAAAVALDTKGNVYVSGETAGSLGGPSHGSYDVWVAKYSTRP